VFPSSITERYLVAETRNAAAVMQMSTPDGFADLVNVLENFSLDFDMLVRPGGNKSKVAKDLDESFRVLGWRETKFQQEVTNHLTIYPWKLATPKEKVRSVSTAPVMTGGHKVDNVKDGAVVDVEWNPKDGNLDRDFGNYTTLHDTGLIDVGVFVTRSQTLRPLAVNLIAQAKAVAVPPTYDEWARRIRKTPNDPFSTSTTSNFEKLLPRMERGDGRGCPILAIAFSAKCYVPPTLSIPDEVLRVAALRENVVKR